MNKTKDTSVYISHVELGGYKSIYKMEIDLLPGLNIIIGPNGSGKTNFVDFLCEGFKSVSRNFDNEEILFKSTIKDDSNSKYSTFSYEILPLLNNDTFIFEYKHSVKIDDVEEEKILEKSTFQIHPNSLVFMILHSGFKSSLLKISNSLPDLQGITEDVHFKASGRVRGEENRGITYTIKGLKVGHSSARALIESICKNFLLSLHQIEETVSVIGGTYSLSKIKLDNRIINNLHRYTPIKDLRIKEGYRVLEKNGEYLFDNIGYEYLIEGQWLRWHQLSDGTKRLFYIVTEVTAVSAYKGPILIEEPELGIHPDQLFRLMDFLLEQAEDKQIILTTHAPMVLDVLGQDDLDRIIITEYDKDKGTTMRHLTKEQKERTQTYMDEEGWLRDYWINADLERAIV